METSWKTFQNAPPQLWMNMRPNFQEFKDAMKQMKSPDSDNFPFELNKDGGLLLQTQISTLILKM